MNELKIPEKPSKQNKLNTLFRLINLKSPNNELLDLYRDFQKKILENNLNTRPKSTFS